MVMTSDPGQADTPPNLDPARQHTGEPSRARRLRIAPVAVAVLAAIAACAASGREVITRLFGPQPLIKLAGAVAVDLDLGEHGEGHAVLRGGELEDLLVGVGLLLTELVAGEGEDVEAVVGVVKRTQTCVLVGEASIGGDVDREADLALVVGEGNRVAGDGIHFELVKRSHGSSLVVCGGGPW